MRAEICAPCCGTEREQTISCPLDCEYLMEARKHEVPPIMDGEKFPNQDIRITEDFLRQNEPLLLMLTMDLLKASMEIPNVIDLDLRDTLEALVKTYRTLQSGLVYESKPANPIAAAVYDRVQAAVADVRNRMQEAGAGQHVRDADVLGIVAFLQRMEIQQNNGRRRSRAFIDFLRQHFPQESPSQPPSSLIL